MNRVSRALCALVVLGSAAATLHAQTIDDGVMMSKRSLCAGIFYGHDSWDRYWEGTLKRDNGNLGTVTTQNVTWAGAYGITDRLNVLAMVPYVWTHASQGVLAGLNGFQDVTLAAKYKLLDTEFTKSGTLQAIVVASVGTPLTDYVVDFQPMSIGLGSTRASGRLTLNFETKPGWFITGSGAYTRRGNVKLDRSSYFTEDHLTFSNEVAMPDVFDYTVSTGYRKGRLEVPISFRQQWTRGGGDIRRQDAPFISNRMNFSKLDAMVKRSLPKVEKLALWVTGGYTLDGRNVGQGTTVTAGFVYAFNF